jgi:hypothetical protein
MDEQKTPGIVSGMATPVGPERVDGPAADSTVVFSGEPEAIREGFIIALRAMGIGAMTTDASDHSNNENDHA